MRITKEIQFDAGHRVPLHTSKCQNPHGHRYRVVAEIDGRVPEDGMVLDFGILKAHMTEEIHDVLDHKFLVQDNDHLALAALEPAFGTSLVRLPFAPTAENLAAWCFDVLQPRLSGAGVTLTAVTVWETPTSAAEYRP